MKLPASPHWVRTSDDHGNPLVVVAVPGAAKFADSHPQATAFATIDADDWEQLGREGWPLQWRLFDRTPYGIRNAVVVTCGRGPRIVAHLIARPVGKQCVKYLDGNPLNLRRGNLVITGLRGGKWSNARIAEMREQLKKDQLQQDQLKQENPK